MARNIQARDAERLPQGEGLEEEPEHRPQPENEPEEPGKRNITPLHLLLNEIPLEKMLSLLQSLNVSFSLSGKGHDFLSRARSYQCTIWGKGILKCQSGGNSPQTALRNALAVFFTHEQRDVHEYQER